MAAPPIDDQAYPFLVKIQRPRKAGQSTAPEPPAEAVGVFLVEQSGVRARETTDGTETAIPTRMGRGSPSDVPGRPCRQAQTR
jgi:hypothetical protein